MYYHIIDEALSSWWGLQAQKGGQPAVFLHYNAIHVQKAGNVRALWGDWDGKGG